ncbi:MAG: hypothetical protein GYA23_00770 [Methanomicrobiales archaeon]|nr:hypothetical protein [Methanomicrobiales archaeon]
MNRHSHILLAAVIALLVLAAVSPAAAGGVANCSLAGTPVSGENAELITAGSGTVYRGSTFSITLEGRPFAEYYLWVRDTADLSGAAHDRPPVILPGQAGVTMDPESGPYTAGSFVVFGSGGRTILDNIPPSAPGAPSTGYYARVATGPDGDRTVKFQTAFETRPGRYRIAAENCEIADEVIVNVEKGAFSIRADGEQKYAMNETIRLHGTNQETNTTFFILTGPGLPRPGVRLTRPSTAVINGDAVSFDSVTGGENGTWTYSWTPAAQDLPGGTYTIYGTSYPFDTEHLDVAAYSTVSIILLGPPTQATTTPADPATLPSNPAPTMAAPPDTPLPENPAELPAGTTRPAIKATATAVPPPLPTTSAPVTRKSPVDPALAGAALLIGTVALLVKQA